MFWGAANITENIALEGYYQYEWKRVGLPPLGTYFSANDLLGGDGINFAMLGAGRFSDQGTDLDTAFALPTGTLGFDPGFFKIPGVNTEKGSDRGQFGLTVSLIPRGTNAATVALHLIRYNSRLPIVSRLTANQSVIDQTTQGAGGQPCTGLHIDRAYACGGGD